MENNKEVNKTEEIWKDIKGYEGTYQISNTGKIFSIKRNIILKQNTSTSGYLFVGLKLNKVMSCKTIHRLVATSFVSNPENKTYVNHVDGNRLNNHVSNLEWVTPRENTLHSNKIRGNKKCSLPGVSYKNNRYVTQLTIGNKKIHVGCFKTAQEANNAYVKALKEKGINDKYTTL